MIRTFTLGGRRIIVKCDRSSKTPRHYHLDLRVQPTPESEEVAAISERIDRLKNASARDKATGAADLKYRLKTLPRSSQTDELEVRILVELLHLEPNRARRVVASFRDDEARYS